MTTLVDEKQKLVLELETYSKKLNVQRLYAYPDQDDTKDWLAQVAGIFKNLDEEDYKSFQNHRQHMYSAIPRDVRQHAAQQIEAFTKEKVATYKRYSFEKQTNISGPYVKNQILEKFVSKQDNFNYDKLIRLITELNSAFASGYSYSSSMLIRGILDHIPPLLGLSDFDQVVNNYPWGETDKKYMKQLLDFKNSADDALHRQISKRSDLIDMTDILPGMNLNRLLQECLVIEGNAKILNSTAGIQTKKSDKGIKVTVHNNVASWANYSQRSGAWSSFRITLEVDNYESKRPDFVTVSMKGKTLSGDWIGNHFYFQEIGRQDFPFKIDAEDLQTVNVFIADHNYDGQRRDKPEIDENGLELTILSKSGKVFVITIPQGNIRTE